MVYLAAGFIFLICFRVFFSAYSNEDVESDGSGRDKIF